METFFKQILIFIFLLRVNCKKYGDDLKLRFLFMEKYNSVTKSLNNGLSFFVYKNTKLVSTCNFIDC